MFLLPQSIHLLDEKPRAQQVARFLRFCPGLSKQTIGELLGEHDDFFLEVLDDFTQTFEFQGEPPWPARPLFRAQGSCMIAGNNRPCEARL